MKYLNKSSCTFWRLLYKHGMFLPRDVAEQAVSAGWAMVEAGHMIPNNFICLSPGMSGYIGWKIYVKYVMCQI